MVTVAVVAKPQRQGLNDNGSGSTTSASAPQQWRRPHDNGDGGSTMTAAAP